MTPPDDSFLPTRSSLLSRLRHASDNAAWQAFSDNYGRLIYQVCLRTGLQRQEAEEVVQETMIAVARQMPRFDYDRGRGSFKGWLAVVTRNHIADFLERKTREAARRVDLPGLKGDAFAARQGATLVDEIWESEWRQHLLDLALRNLRKQLPARSVQIFHMSVVDGWEAEKIAGALQISRAQVYLARHRASRLVKREIERLQNELD